MRLRATAGRVLPFVLAVASTVALNALRPGLGGQVFTGAAALFWGYLAWLARRRAGWQRVSLTSFALAFGALFVAKLRGSPAPERWAAPVALLLVVIGVVSFKLRAGR